MQRRNLRKRFDVTVKACQAMGSDDRWATRALVEPLRGRRMSATEGDRERSGGQGEDKERHARRQRRAVTHQGAVTAGIAVWQNGMLGLARVLRMSRVLGTVADQAGSLMALRPRHPCTGNGGRKNDQDQRGEGQPFH
ncbi:hypothetical protein DYGSA30_04120 [Dyella sp. GSA-30]|nr:hypothetical protein DYGSA30_04120 [Dyella sp. GSA-30]